MTPRDEFFIGWASLPGPRLRRFLLLAGLVLLVALPGLGLVLGSAADDPAPAGFATVPGRPALADLPEPADLSGLLLPGPSPLLQLTSGRTLLLAGDGKYGAQIDPALIGHAVRAQGFILRRGDIEMLVVQTPPTALPDAVAPVLPVPEPLGRWRISGEICDGKCASGAMVPGIGLAHRACAALCLDGAIPAVFVATHPVLGHAFLLLADAVGGSPMPAFRDRIGRRVTLQGAVERRGGLLVFRAEAP